MKNTDKTIWIRITPEEHREWKMLAAKSGLSLSAFIRKIAKKGLENQG